jgi:hypothetical protein
MSGKRIAERWFDKLDGIIFPMLVAGLGAVMIAPAGMRYATGMAVLLAAYVVLARLLFTSPPAPEALQNLRRRLGRGWFARNELLNDMAGAVLSRREVLLKAWPTIITALTIAVMTLRDIPNV